MSFSNRVSPDKRTKTIQFWPNLLDSATQILYMPLFMGNIPHLSLFFELTEGTSPVHSRAGSHIFLLSMLLCRFDEPVKLLPGVFVKMMFIHFQFNLMPTPGYLCRHRNKPIDKTPVFLPFVLVFLLTYHHRYVVYKDA